MLAVVDVKQPVKVVALLAEGVDRNVQIDGNQIAFVDRRPPRGGRG